jgi:hypothetical protein
MFYYTLPTCFDSFCNHHKEYKEYIKLPNCVSESLNIIIDVSSFPYGHKIAVYMLLTTDKIQWLKTNKDGCIVVCSEYTPCIEFVHA